MRQCAAMLNCTHFACQRSCKKRGAKPRLEPDWHLNFLLHRCLEHFADVVPIYQVVKECFEVVGTPIAVIDVIGMLPYIAAKYWLGAVHKRILAVRGFHDCQLAVLDREPAPARTELRDTGLDQVFLDLCQWANV